jgi:dihydroxy-acid dehydratase
LIPDEDLEDRLSRWSPPESKVKRGYLGVYARLAKSADKGAALNYDI